MSKEYKEYLELIQQLTAAIKIVGKRLDNLEEYVGQL
jgi:hypothetical protein